MLKVYVLTMTGTIPETGTDARAGDAAGPGRMPAPATKGSEVQKIVDTLKAVGKDPNTTSLAEAQEICRLLDSSKHHENMKFFRQVMAVLGAIVLVSVIGMVLLAVSGKTLPVSLVALGSAALGLFAGILVASCREF